MKPIDRILRAKREEIEHLKKTEDPDTLRKRAGNAPPVRDFRSAIHIEGQLSLIAEIKKSSPSRGKIAGVDVTDLARQYDEVRRRPCQCLPTPTLKGISSTFLP